MSTPLYFNEETDYPLLKRGILSNLCTLLKLGTEIYCAWWAAKVSQQLAANAVRNVTGERRQVIPDRVGWGGVMGSHFHKFLLSLLIVHNKFVGIYDHTPAICKTRWDNGKKPIIMLNTVFQS